MKKNNKITIRKTRSTLYKSAKILGDINAVKRGAIGRWLTYRLTGKISSRILSKLIRTISDIIGQLTWPMMKNKPNFK